ncbi:lysine--tRNA ligase [Haladaptatus halobius]|uniref:lysine--tRNA ligase n=1 Tax=Haladaptatus halobius TaxID=2884875 RepID=UPI001D0B20AD|nr:lysine--tRNA ligase [Haladaptatus halobius]
MSADSAPTDDRDGSGDDHHVFWADEVADRIEARDPDDPIIIKGGISPSGVPHLGNVNEIMRGYFVAEALRDRGHEVRQVFTADDRDPLRKLPRKLADLAGNIVELGDVNAGALGRNLGKPYTDIPDPFGCCDSYGDHFSNLIQQSADLLGVPINVVSNTELYETGELEDVTRHLLEHAEEAREVLAEYQDKVDDEYVPFNPICEECGKITETVTDFDVEEGTVEYVCTDLEAGDNTIDGCGHEGTATLREGKLPWRFEWPAQWKTLSVDFEPFGKDHAEGSWPSGEDIARNVMEFEPPEPMTYEWFTLDGKPFSSSEGNVVLVKEVLDLLEPEVLRYFFTKDPYKARDFSIERLDLLVDEFDRFERVYFGEEDADERERALAERAYPMAVSEIRPERIRIPYTFAAVLGMTDDPDLREEIARRESHIPDDAPDWAVEGALARVERARTWARRTSNEYDYDLKRTELPNVALDSETEEALDELAEFVEAGHDGEAIQGEIYETAKRHDIDIGEFFGTGYRLFFDEEQGPKLGPFLSSLDREFVLRRLRREG